MNSVAVITKQTWQSYLSVVVRKTGETQESHNLTCQADDERPCLEVKLRLTQDGRLWHAISCFFTFHECAAEWFSFSGWGSGERELSEICAERSQSDRMRSRASESVRNPPLVGD